MSNREQIPAQIRRLVLDRDDHTCQLCGARGTQGGGEHELHLHHRVSPVDGGSHSPNNLVTLCSACHHHHHSTRATREDVRTDLEECDISTTPADVKVVGAVEAIGPATTGEIADEACISNEHARRRLYALAGAKVVAQTLDQQWDIAERVDEPARGRLPDNPERAAQLGRDVVIARMRDADMSIAEIASIVGLDERTIPVAANRARALNPPLPPSKGEEPDLTDIERRLASIERELES